MNIKYTFILLFIFSVFISSCSQILLKKGANKTYDNILQEYLGVEEEWVETIFGANDTAYAVYQFHK